MSTNNWWGNWRTNLPAHTGDLQPTDLIECTSIVGGVPVNTAITGQQIIDAAQGGGGSASWGGITGTLSNQIDLQSALNAKQDTLVSGTNIKTVNGSSLLGSGNVSINGITSIGSSVGITVSGTTTGTISGSVLIPAGTISEGQNLMIRAKIRKISGTGTCIARLGINTTNSTTGSLQIGQSPTLANNTFTHVIRDPHYTNSSLYTISAGAANFHDLTSQTTSLISFNPAVDYYLFVVLFNSTTLDVTKTLKLSVLKYD